MFKKLIWQAWTYTRKSVLVTDITNGIQQVEAKGWLLLYTVIDFRRKDENVLNCLEENSFYFLFAVSVFFSLTLSERRYQWVKMTMTFLIKIVESLVVPYLFFENVYFWDNENDKH